MTIQGDMYYAHHTEEKTGAQRGLMTYPNGSKLASGGAEN